MLQQASKFLYSISAWIPGRIGRGLRFFLIRGAALDVRGRVSIDTGVRITGWEGIAFLGNNHIDRNVSLHAHNGTLVIGAGTSVGPNSIVSACDGGAVYLGEDVMIGPNVVIRAADHGHARSDIPMVRQGHVGGLVSVGDDVWIGANAVLTKNAAVGAHSIIGAGAVVTNSFEPYSVVGGVPAKLIKSRK